MAGLPRAGNPCRNTINYHSSLGLCVCVGHRDILVTKLPPDWIGDRHSAVKGSLPGRERRVAELLRGEPDSIRLSLEGEREGDPRYWYVPCALPRWTRSLGDRVKVRAHIDPEPGGPIVVVTDLGIIWPLPGSPTSAAAGHLPAPDDNPLHLLEQRLAEQGFARQAQRLSAVSAATYTSSSELLGDYGLAMRAIRAECWRRIDPQTRHAYGAAARAVRVAWSKMRL